MPVTFSGWAGRSPVPPSSALAVRGTRGRGSLPVPGTGKGGWGVPGAGGVDAGRSLVLH